MPIAFPAQPRQDCVIPRRTKPDQFASAFPTPAPLFPVAHANTTPEPMIQCNGIVVLQSDTEVVHPAVKLRTDFFLPASHRDSPTAACEAMQFLDDIVDLRNRVRNSMQSVFPRIRSGAGSGSHDCTPASFRTLHAETPLPLARTFGSIH
jgi:hypothetical protein